MLEFQASHLVSINIILVGRERSIFLRGGVFKSMPISIWGLSSTQFMIHRRHKVKSKNSLLCHSLRPEIPRLFTIFSPTTVFLYLYYVLYPGFRVIIRGRSKEKQIYSILSGNKSLIFLIRLFVLFSFIKVYNSVFLIYSQSVQPSSLSK